MNRVKIDQKIISASVVKEATKSTKCIHDNNGECSKPEKEITNLKRDYKLRGTTYKIKPPTLGTTLYITINDFEGKPFEIFLNSKHTEHKPWMDALTRMMSAAFRTQNDVNYLVKELKQVQDATGSYFLKGRNYPSVVAHIGWVIDEHINGEKPTKKDKYEASKTASESITEDTPIEATSGSSGENTEGSVKYLDTPCPECGEYKLILQDGCPTCLSCFYSKCQ